MTYRRRSHQDRDPAQLSRRSLLLAAAAAAAAPLTACAGSSDGPPLLTAADVPRAEPAPDAPVAELRAAITTFGHRIATAGADAHQNWIASPLSIACAFAMARAGAAGDTAAQLDRVFGFPRGGLHDGLNSITRGLVTIDGPPAKLADHKPGDPPPAPIVNLGNALFTDEGLPVGQAFLTALAAHYGTGARPVDFRSGKAAAQINTWVSRQTAGRIKRLFDQLDPSTSLVLANAIYFKGYWASAMQAGGGAAEPFTRADGRQVAASMMSQTGSLRYASVDGVQAIDLPYGGGPYAMRIILPPPGSDPVRVLDPATVTAVAAAMTEQQVTVSLPRFGFDTDLDLGRTLPQLGLNAPFGPDADFSGIAAGLFISQAVHRANITVDEEGTEAAAATGVGIAVSAQLPAARIVRADRPFAFMIVGGADRMPLFVGQLHDPTVT